MTAPFDQPFYDRLMDEPDVRDHATHTDGWMRGYAYCAIVAARIAAERVAVSDVTDDMLRRAYRQGYEAHADANADEQGMYDIGSAEIAGYRAVIALAIAVISATDGPTTH